MEANHHRFYTKRAVEESLRAARSITPAARNWHDKLAKDFAKRAGQFDQLPREAASQR
jgi:hypothetical protein